ncbi:hypothetical protein DAT35_47305 [Vitiosangium sp. GDMCC 1.1324]|nr:hypothetical protein DAT35_47305 [Vitiosangium sp. GDMCC 1.1324]
MNTAKVQSPKLEGGEKKQPTIMFTPRVNAEGKKQRLDPNATKPYSQGVAPPFGPDRASSKPMPDVNVNGTACLVHGTMPEFVEGAIKDGHLGSAYRREGPTGNYSRDADKRGGGGLAVYTRAVGTEHTKWQAMGYGVGSNENKVQLILSPEILNKPNHTWRASSTDNMGKAPGVLPADLADVKNGKKDGWDLWAKQSERGRNQAFNETVKAQPKGGFAENNEQMHWEKIPLQDSLKGAVCTSQSSFDTLMKIPGATRKSDTEGTIPMGEKHVPVIFASKDTSLLGALKRAGIANDSNQVG